LLDEARLREVVGSMLELDPAQVDDTTSTDTVPSWDSVRHMNLVIALEQAFGITVPDEDVADMTSFPIIRAVVEEQLAGQ
jgi:acyl carrier protein